MFGGVRGLDRADMRLVVSRILSWDPHGNWPGKPHHLQPAARLPAARLPGTLDTLEAVVPLAARARLVAHAEQAPSLRAAVDALRTDAVELPGAMRWVRRRIRLVHHVLRIVIGLLPEHLARCIAEVGAVRARLQTDTALRALRTLTAAQLRALPAPLGFHPHRLNTTNRNRALQHKMGPDPPPSPA